MFLHNHLSHVDIGRILPHTATVACTHHKGSQPGFQLMLFFRGNEAERPSAGSSNEWVMDNEA
ncbi:MAG: hypothetical protein H6658_14370 [Ardenticatenaceae bacterium]|nr:hypothetical protein [Ardenticatenaceae bacterium]